jgi:hypothetical protein
MAASRQDIEAGKAVVTLATNNEPLVRGLDKGKESLQVFAQAAAGIGAVLGTASAAILAPIAAGVNHFINVGKTLSDISQKLKISRKEVAETFAAGHIGVSEKDVANALALSDAIVRIRTNFESLTLQIGAALAPSLIEFLRLAEGVSRWAARFVASNRLLIVGITGLGIALGVASAGFLALAAAASVAVLAIIGVNAALALTPAGWLFLAIAAAIAGAVVQLTIFAAGVVALTVAFFTLTKTGRELWAAMTVEFQKFTATVRTGFVGIADAIQAGDMEMAWKVSCAAMTLAWKGVVEGVLSDIKTIAAALPLGGFVAGGIPTGHADTVAAAKRLLELNQQAAAARARSEMGSLGGADDYGFSRGASVIGHSAGAASRAAQIVGANGSPIVAELKNVVNEHRENRRVLEEIKRKIDVPKFR